MDTTGVPASRLHSYRARHRRGISAITASNPFLACRRVGSSEGLSAGTRLDLQSTPICAIVKRLARTGCSAFKRQVVGHGDDDRQLAYLNCNRITLDNCAGSEFILLVYRRVFMDPT